MAIGDRTSTFTVDNVGNPEPVIVNSWSTKEVLIYENAGANTTDFKVRQPLMTSAFVWKQIGGQYTFTRTDGGSWGVGDVVGYVETVTASTATFAQEEK